MQDIKWHIEALRIGITVISVVVAVVLYGAKLETQIALNQQSIGGNQETIKNIEMNHLPHIQERVDEIAEIVYKIEALLTK